MNTYNIPFTWMKFSEGTLNEYSEPTGPTYADNGVLWGRLEALQSVRGTQTGGASTSRTATVYIGQIPDLGEKDQLVDPRTGYTWEIVSTVVDYDNYEIMCDVTA
jgi:hypothetical protein